MKGQANKTLEPTCVAAKPLRMPSLAALARRSSR